MSAEKISLPALRKMVKGLSFKPKNSISGLHMLLNKLPGPCLTTKEIGKAIDETAALIQQRSTDPKDDIRIETLNIIRACLIRDFRKSERYTRMSSLAAHDWAFLLDLEPHWSQNVKDIELANEKINQPAEWMPRISELPEDVRSPRHDKRDWHEQQAGRWLLERIAARDHQSLKELTIAVKALAEGKKLTDLTEVSRLKRLETDKGRKHSRADKEQYIVGALLRVIEGTFKKLPKRQDAPFSLTKEEKRYMDALKSKQKRLKLEDDESAALELFLLAPRQLDIPTTLNKPTRDQIKEAAMAFRNARKTTFEGDEISDPQLTKTLSKYCLNDFIVRGKPGPGKEKRQFRPGK